MCFMELVSCKTTHCSPSIAGLMTGARGAVGPGLTWCVFVHKWSLSVKAEM